MKKLIIYDESCPMCNLYTKGLVATDTDGCLTRMSNSQVAQDTLNRLDQQRARHEIPLVDLDGGETLYGIDAWIHVIGQRYPFIEKVGSLGWFKAVLTHLYAFISYNRRIIITSAPGRWNLLDLQPDFRFSYRIAFITIVFILIGALFAGVHFPVWLPAALAVVVGQLTLATLYLGSRQDNPFSQTLLDYVGHLAMSLLIGELVAGIGLITGFTALVSVGYALMVGQHFIRCYRLSLNAWLSVCFTILVFVLILPR